MSYTRQKESLAGNIQADFNASWKVSGDAFDDVMWNLIRREREGEGKHAASY